MINEAINNLSARALKMEMLFEERAKQQDEILEKIDQLNKTLEALCNA